MLWEASTPFKLLDFRASEEDVIGWQNPQHEVLSKKDPQRVLKEKQKKGIGKIKEKWKESVKESVAQQQSVQT